MELKDKIVWISGASSGIGEALAYACAQEGAKLILSARREEELKRVAENCKLHSDNILVLPLDLEHTQNIDEKVNTVLQKFGRIDVLVNNSGMGHRTKVVNTPTEIDRKVMEINFFGTITLTKAVTRIMQKQQNGKIVVVTSIMGKYGMPIYATYSASKHALNGYFESLRCEIQKDNIHVLVVCPGFIRTDVDAKLLMADGKPYGIKSESLEKGMPPEKCAKAIVKAIKSNAEHKYIGGYEIFSVVVKQFFPRMFYKLMRKMTKE